MNDPFRAALAVCALGAVSACQMQQQADGTIRISANPLAARLTRPQARPPLPVAVGGTAIVRAPKDYPVVPAAAVVPAVSTKSAMRFEGMMDGGLGQVELQPVQPSVYHVFLQVEGQQGIGAADGLATKRGDIYTLQQASGGLQCDVDMRQRGSTLEVREKSCGAMHGASVSFDGSLHAVRSGTAR